MDVISRTLILISLVIGLIGCSTESEQPSAAQNSDLEREQEERKRAEMQHRKVQAAKSNSQEQRRRIELERRAREKRIEPPSSATSIPINPMKLFQWPPPKPSSFSVVLRDYLSLPNSSPSLGQIENLLRKSLDSAGYYDVSYYGIEAQSDGFVVATRLEQINDNATSVDGEERWVNQLGKAKSFSLSDYLNELFYAKPGKYRIILFTVSAEPIDFGKQRVSVATAKAWVSDGSASLTNSIKEQEFTEQHQVTALIYEFERFEDDNNNEIDSGSKNYNTILNLPGKHQTRTHLENAGIWSSMTTQ